MTNRNFRMPDLARLGTARAAAIIIVSLVLLGVVAGVAWNLVQGPRWTATTNVLVRLSSVDSLLLTGNTDSVSISDQIDDSSLATSQDTLTQVANQLHPRGGLAQLQRDVNATPQGSSHVIVISATEPDPVTAQRISDAVAATFVATTQKRLAALGASAAAAAGPPNADSALLARAQWISKAAQPLQVFHDQLPTRISPAHVPAALGLVGLAAGTLVVLALSFLGLRVDRPRDAQRLLSLPAVPYDRSQGGGAATTGLVQAVLHAHPDGKLLICPVDPDAELAAVRFAGWVREHGQNGDVPTREVQLVPDPTSAVIGARPGPDEAAGLLLVVPRGTSRQVLTDAVALLATWRSVDAVAVTT
jgi:capsular polysaccharide biosynthesis protein